MHQKNEVDNNDPIYSIKSNESELSLPLVSPRRISMENLASEFFGDFPMNFWGFSSIENLKIILPIDSPRSFILIYGSFATVVLLAVVLLRVSGKTTSWDDSFNELTMKLCVLSN